MKVNVVLYNTVQHIKEDLSLLCQQNMQIPKGFSLSGGSRKFIVLLREEIDGVLDTNDIIVAIGEQFWDKYYNHKDILGCVKAEFPEYRVSGGGEVDFEHKSYYIPPLWNARFSGSSGDFGVFNKVLLENDVAQAISKAISMNVRVVMDLSVSDAMNR